MFTNPGGETAMSMIGWPIARKVLSAALPSRFARPIVPGRLLQ